MKKIGLLLFVIILLQVFASYWQGLADMYAKYMTPIFVQTIGRFSNLFPFSLFEWWIVGVILGSMYIIIKKRSAIMVVQYILVICLVFTLTTGIQYKRSSINHRMNFTKVDYTKEDLIHLCEYVTHQLIVMEHDELTQKQIKEEAKNTMNKIIPGYYPNAKGLFFSKWMTISGLSGIFSPFTIEANYNKDMPLYQHPFTICHELSHLQGYMSEDEANFLAYLGCTQSSKEYFQYSGYINAFVYITNELYSLDIDITPYYSQLPQWIKEDMNQNNQFWNQYGDTMSNINNQINDAYLKINSVEEGIESYSMFITLIYSYYISESIL